MTSAADRLAAWDVGQQAHQAGLGLDACPYEVGHELRHWWTGGWWGFDRANLRRAVLERIITICSNAKAEAHLADDEEWGGLLDKIVDQLYQEDTDDRTTSCV